MKENKLENLRKQIDIIDTKIVELFSKRFELVKQIGKIKQKNKIPVVDGNRFQQVLEKVKKIAEKQGISKDFIEEIYNIIHKYACELEHNLSIKIGHQGISGAFSHIATKQLFHYDKIISFSTFELLFKALQKDQINLAVIPIKNSYTGKIPETNDLMKKYKFKIIKKLQLPIRHNLVAVKGTQLNDITDIFSHEQALKQCQKNIKKILPKAKLQIMKNTAMSAQYVKQKNNKHYACICSADAIKEYKLENLYPNFQDKKDNYTLFAVIAK